MEEMEGMKEHEGFAREIVRWRRLNEIHKRLQVETGGDKKVSFEITRWRRDKGIV